MSLQIRAALFAKGAPPPLSRYVPLFHDVIREERLPPALIDVADYGHLTDSPKIVLVGHSGDYSVSVVGGRLAIAYRCKRATPTSDETAQVLDAFAGLLRLAALLLQTTLHHEDSFVTTEFGLQFLDRLRFPATPEGESFARHLIQKPLLILLPSGFEVERVSVETEPLTFRITTQEAAPTDTLLSRTRSAQYA